MQNSPQSFDHTKQKKCLAIKIYKKKQFTLFLPIRAFIVVESHRWQVWSMEMTPQCSSSSMVDMGICSTMQFAQIANYQHS